MEKLEFEINKKGITVTSKSLQKLKLFGDLIEKENKFQNLTSHKSWQSIRDNLFIRSLSIYDVLNDFKLRNLNIIDVGTGLGIPGLLIKILNPETNVSLLDSNKKKMGFVNKVIYNLDIQDVQTVVSRAEKEGHNPIFREAFDIVVSRGVAKLPQLAELTLPFCKLNGSVICLKGNEIDQELKESRYASAILGSERVRVLSVIYKESLFPDKVVVWEKTQATPPKFPRRNGMPKKYPLILRNSHDS